MCFLCYPPPPLRRMDLQHRGVLRLISGPVWLQLSAATLSDMHRVFTASRPACQPGSSAPPPHPPPSCGRRRASFSDTDKRPGGRGRDRVHSGCLQRGQHGVQTHNNIITSPCCLHPPHDTRKIMMSPSRAVGYITTNIKTKQKCYSDGFF